MNGFVGEIRMFAGNFAPRNWAFCQGQLLAIAQNTALFSILGTIYGGDGRTTFALPDLRGRVPYSSGTGPGLPTIRQGAKAGTETNTMTTLTMPNHNHLVQVTKDKMKIPVGDGAATTTDPNGAYLTDTAVNFYSNVNPTGFYGDLMATLSATLDNTGNQQPYNNIMPSLVMNYIICMMGTYPSRS